jgi:hypothetical protein
MYVRLAAPPWNGYPLARDTQRIAEGPPSMNVTGPFRFLGSKRAVAARVFRAARFIRSISLISDALFGPRGLAEFIATRLIRRQVRRHRGD